MTLGSHILSVAQPAAAVTAAVAILGIFAPEILRRFALIDRPNARSLHTHAPARSGGLIIIAGALALAAWVARPPLPLKIWVAALLVAGISFADDVKGMPARLRFAVHLLGAGLVAMEVVGPGDARVPVVLCGLAVVVGVAGYVNAFNFMDGINGLASVQAIVTGVGTVVLSTAAGGSPAAWPAVLALGCAAGCVGFLPHNVPQARMFMGDVGSATLGLLLAASAAALAELHGGRMIIPVVLLHLNFVLETSITLLRRIWRREKWFEAHREHFYQRLVRSGAPHWMVSFGYAVLQSVALLAAWQAWLAPETQLIWLAGVTVLWLAVFGWSERRFQTVCSERG
jgi:UDP-N-acetylmuramyl pentapeptide phosphotransferase/UDP-N-acetylglucosamine-1-phosphate transferase